MKADSSSSDAKKCAPEGASTELSEAEAIAARDADFTHLDHQVEVTKLKEELSSARKEAEEHKDRYLRALAELENYKKRALKDRADLLKYQGDRIFVDILPVLDNLELALQHSDADVAKLRSGLQLIHKLFVDTLGKWEVRAESGIGKEFDPARHSALSKVPSAEQKPGTILSEFRKAYFYKDKLLRPSEVVVASEPSEPGTGPVDSTPDGGAGNN